MSAARPLGAALAALAIVAFALGLRLVHVLALEPDHPKLLRRWSRLRRESHQPLNDEETKRMERAMDASPGDDASP